MRMVDLQQIAAGIDVNVVRDDRARRDRKRTKRQHKRCRRTEELIDVDATTGQDPLNPTYAARLDVQ